MPVAAAARLEGEAIGVLAGDLVAVASERVEVALEGEAFAFFVRVGAMVRYRMTARRNIWQGFCGIFMECFQEFKCLESTWTVRGKQ